MYRLGGSLQTSNVKYDIICCFAISNHHNVTNSEQNRLLSRLQQSMAERNRPKLQKYLTRAKELNPKGALEDISRAEVLLRELLDEEGMLIFFSVYTRYYTPSLSASI